jgi:hypothetical protein
MPSENKRRTTYNLATSQLVEGKKVWKEGLDQLGNVVHPRER